MTTPPDTVLPCGCVIRNDVVDGVNTMFFIPCRLDCRNYTNMLAMADEQGKPVEQRQGP